MDLLTPLELPAGFAYPPEFLDLVRERSVDLTPWHFLEGEQLRWRNGGLRARYPSRTLVPFARRQDNDDVACWDVAIGDGVVTIIHDFAEEGWEGRDWYQSFDGWRVQATAEHDTFD